MKKTNLNSLKLNKKSISNLNQRNLKGGGNTLGGGACPLLPPIDNPAPDPIDDYPDPDPIFSIIEVC